MIHSTSISQNSNNPSNWSTEYSRSSSISSSSNFYPISLEDTDQDQEDNEGVLISEYISDDDLKTEVSIPDPKNRNPENRNPENRNPENRNPENRNPENRNPSNAVSSRPSWLEREMSERKRSQSQEQKSQEKKSQKLQSQELQYQNSPEIQAIY